MLPPSEINTRPPLAKEGNILDDTLLAEHGLSLLITVTQGETKHTVLFDTGYTKVGVLHNIEQLGVNVDEIESIVISHGHMDHTGSLYGILDKIPGTIPLVVHPGAFDYCGDGIDQDCSGSDQLCPGDIDNDGDGYTENQGDCNDSSKSILIYVT